MEIYKDVPKKFLPMFERHEPVIQDHSATIKFKECPRKYFYEYVLAMKDLEVPVHLNFGTCYHKFRELLELDYFSKSDKTSAAQLESLQVAIAGTMKLWDKIQGSDPMIGTKWDFMSKNRLLESCLFAFKHWQNEKRQRAIEVIATEQAVNVTIAYLSGRVITVGGRADQIVRWNGQLWGRDFKTTSKKLDYYDRRNDPNDQFIRYTFMEGELNGERLHGQMIEVLYNGKVPKTERAKTPSGPIIQLFPVSFSPSQVNRWKEEQEYWDECMKMARENDMYPMSYVNQACSWCQFRSVCTSTSELGMESKLKQNFKQAPWDHQNSGDGDD